MSAQHARRRVLGLLGAAALTGLAGAVRADHSAAGQVTANFELPGLDGRRYSVAEYRGKWVVVNFWATWCGTCVEEMGELQAFADARADAQVLAVNFEQIDTPALTAFVSRLGLRFPVLRVGDKPLVPFEPLKGLPTTVIVDPSGRIVAHHLGAVTRAALEAFIDADRVNGEGG